LIDRESIPRPDHAADRDFYGAFWKEMDLGVVYLQVRREMLNSDSNISEFNWTQYP
jgi:hypothetical protein